jgi:nitroreductase
MNEVLKAIKSRRSIRSYRPEQISREELDLIIEAGIYAPYGPPAQPWHFTVVQSPEAIRRINAVSKDAMAKSNVEWIKKFGSNPDIDITHKAPTLIVVSGKKDSLTALTDCSAAVENMLLAAESLNIGSIWLGFAMFCFQSEGEAAKLGIPEGYAPVHTAAFGYKAQDTQPKAPARNYDVVNYIR